jgi:protein-tyrosine phosphatase
MFTEIVPHLFLGEELDQKRRILGQMILPKPYLFVDARPFFNILSGDANGEELMIEPLRALSASLAILVSNDVDVYIYCQAGLERSPFLTALVLHQLGKGTLEECYNQVASKRPQTLVYSQWVEAIYLFSKENEVDEN